MRDLLPRLLDRSAERWSGSPAVSGPDGELTYGAAAMESDRLAHLLRAEGVAPGDRVAVCLSKSVRAVTALYGILKTGAAYVPLEPTAPPRRWAFVLRDCGVRHLVASAAARDRLLGLPADEVPPLTILLVDAGSEDRSGRHRCIGWERVASTPPSPPDLPLDPEGLAYVLYTSGSSGTPKGVAISHRASLAFVRWAMEACGFRQEDRFASHAPFHFDLSVLDLFAAAGAGGTVVLVPEAAMPFPVRLAELIQEREISVWYSVPSALTQLVVRGRMERFAYPRLRLVLFAGEVFPAKYLRALAARVPHVTLYNLYGPTETNVCTYYRLPPLPPDFDGRIPIGRACEGTEVFALTEEGRPGRTDEVAELYVSGPTLMTAYWGQAAKTRQVLVPHPLEPGRTPVYRTGDLVRLQADGHFVFVGRRDHMIKSRGYRIELEEVESVLQACPSVLEAVALGIPDEPVGHRLVAAVVPAAGTTCTEREVRGFCAERLPPYMVPERVAIRAALPKTSTGKVDRLRALEECRGSATRGDGPR